jgi:hypothetical protein
MDTTAVYNPTFKLIFTDRGVGVEKEYNPSDPLEDPKELFSGSPPVKCGLCIHRFLPVMVNEADLSGVFSINFAGST